MSACNPVRRELVQGPYGFVLVVSPADAPDTDGEEREDEEEMERGEDPRTDERDFAWFDDI